MTKESKGSEPGQPWHYNAMEGRPEWSKEMARQLVIQRQNLNEMKRRKERAERVGGHAPK